MTTMFDVKEKNTLEETKGEWEELRKQAEAKKRKCNSLKCKVGAGLSSKRADERRRDLVDAEKDIKLATLNLGRIRGRLNHIYKIESIEALSGGVITKLKKGAETRQMIEGRNKQLAAEREQNRLRKFGGVLTRRRR